MGLWAHRFTEVTKKTKHKLENQGKNCDKNDKKSNRPNGLLLFILLTGGEEVMLLIIEGDLPDTDAFLFREKDQLLRFFLYRTYRQLVFDVSHVPSDLQAKYPALTFTCSDDPLS